MAPVAAIPVAVQAAALAISAAAGAYAAYAQKQAGDFQAAIAKRNADAEEKAAQDAQARGLNEGVAQALKGGQARGAIRAGFGASGVELTSGSPLDVLSDAAMFNELDKQTIKANAEREAYSHRVGAGNYLAQAGADKATGRNAAIGTVLTTGSQVAGDWYKLKDPKAA